LRGRDAEAAHENQERWLLTYADLITLLMVFFVVMYSMSRADVSKFAKLQAALQRAFHVEVLKGDTPTSIGGEHGASPVRLTLEETPANPAFVALDNRLISTVDDLRQALSQLPGSESSAQVQIGPARDGVVISLSGNVLFDSGKAELKPRGMEMLNAVAGRLRLLPNEVRIEGHTDDIPISTRAYPTNWELSAARATTVARYLSEPGGITAPRLVAAGYGQHRPVESNGTREGRARNRRVDIVVIFPSPVPSSAPAPLPPPPRGGGEGEGAEPGTRNSAPETRNSPEAL
jgi:chemotaxis protein MotB